MLLSFCYQFVFIYLHERISIVVSHRCSCAGMSDRLSRQRNNSGLSTTRRLGFQKASGKNVSILRENPGQHTTRTKLRNYGKYEPDYSSIPLFCVRYLALAHELETLHLISAISVHCAWSAARATLQSPHASSPEILHVPLGGLVHHTPTITHCSCFSLSVCFSHQSTPII